MNADESGKESETFARLSVKTLYKLLSGKEAEVDDLRSRLTTAEQELTALRALYQRTDTPERTFSFKGLVEAIKGVDPRVGELLSACRCIEMDLGLLKIGCPKIEAQMVRIFKSRIEELAEEFVGVPVALEVREE